jgi:hypothetical protein
MRALSPAAKYRSCGYIAIFILYYVEKPTVSSATPYAFYAVPSSNLWIRKQKFSALYVHLHGPAHEDDFEAISLYYMTLWLYAQRKPKIGHPERVFFCSDMYSAKPLL